jgi:predicted transcriptional regulator
MTIYLKSGAYNPCMDKLIEELLYIEQRAAEAWDRLADEKDALMKHMQDEISRRAGDINREADIAIQNIAQTLARETASAVNRIETDNKNAIAHIEAVFAKNNGDWRERIKLCIVKA